MQHAASATDRIFDVTASDFDANVVNAGVPVLVDFWAPWCGPCRQIAPVLESLAEAYDGQLSIAKVNVDEEPELASGFGVRGIPFLVLFSGGEVVEQITGVQPEAALRRLIDRHVSTAPAALREAIRQAIADGDHAEALPLLEQAHAADPDQPDTVADLATCLAALGRADEADALLRRLPADVAMAPAVAQARAQIALQTRAEGLRDRAALEALIEERPDDLTARHELARVAAAAADFDTALDNYLEIMQRDRTFGDDAGRRGLVDVFEAIGSDDERVRTYRRRMASLLN